MHPQWPAQAPESTKAFKTTSIGAVFATDCVLISDILVDLDILLGLRLDLCGLCVSFSSGILNLQVDGPGKFLYGGGARGPKACEQTLEVAHLIRRQGLRDGNVGRRWMVPGLG
jgi:hypothetical protein